MEQADLPKLLDMFKACDTNTFPVGENLTFINIFNNAVARVESICLIKAEPVLLLLICSILCWKIYTHTEVLVQFSQHKIKQINRATRYVLLHNPQPH